MKYQAFALLLSSIIYYGAIPLPGTKPSKENHADTVDRRLKITLPPAGKLNGIKPVGRHWENMIGSFDSWNADQRYWKLDGDGLHGDYNGGPLHNYSWTKKTYGNFELNVLIKMSGREANSGVCIRIQPTDADNAPGYQVDMGPGYWGSLWEERRAGMVQLFPQNLVPLVVKDQDWNHYYIMARDHHIQAWLNGIKTIDIIHQTGLSRGSIGFQLCHGDKHTSIDVKSLYIREL